MHVHSRECLLENGACLLLHFTSCVTKDSSNIQYIISKLSNFHTIIDSNLKIQNFHFTQEIANFEYDVQLAYHLKNSAISELIIP